MSATISTNGDPWTTINFTVKGPTTPNDPILPDFDGAALQSTPWPELRQFIELAMAGYSCTYQEALKLVEVGIRIELARPQPSLSDTYTP